MPIFFKKLEKVTRNKLFATLFGITKVLGYLRQRVDRNKVVSLHRSN